MNHVIPVGFTRSCIIYPPHPGVDALDWLSGQILSENGGLSDHIDCALVFLQANSMNDYSLIRSIERCQATPKLLIQFHISGRGRISYARDPSLAAQDRSCL